MSWTAEMGAELPRPELAETGMAAFERLEPQRGHSRRHSVTAVLDPIRHDQRKSNGCTHVSIVAFCALG